MLRQASIATAALTAALALAACGSDDPAPTPDTRETTTTTTAGASDLRREFEDQLRAVLEQRAQEPLVDVDCVVKRLRETLPNDLVEAGAAAAERGEEIPHEAVDAAFEAGQDCVSG